jgi:hypothetical protein
LLFEFGTSSFTGGFVSHIRRLVDGRSGMGIVAVTLALAISACQPAAGTPTPLQDSLDLLVENTGLVGPPDANAAATYAYFHDHVRFGGTSHADSAFTYDFDCPGCAKPAVRLTVVPEKKAFKVDWPTAFVNQEPRGWIVAKFMNVDNVKFLPLDLGPNETAYQWVGPLDVSGDRRAVAYYKVNLGTGQASEAMRPHASFGFCRNPNWRARSKSSAKHQHPDGETCSEFPVPSGMRAATLAKHTRGALASSGTWLSCVGGCCEQGIKQFEVSLAEK